GVDDVNLESWLEEPEMASVFEFVSSLDAKDDSDQDEEDDDHFGDEDADEVEPASGTAGSDSDVSERHTVGTRGSGRVVGSAMSIPVGLKSRSPLKRAREERIEELTREIDELLDSDSDSDGNGYLSAEE
ncbi:hypothetical protein GGI02_005597, partial [Coemansia sp. RSA 2322]